MPNVINGIIYVEEKAAYLNTLPPFLARRVLIRKVARKTSNGICGLFVYNRKDKDG